MHKTLGITYIIVLLFITGPAAFIMSLYATGGRITQTSFTLLSILWIGFTYIAYLKIRRRTILSHVKWMIRSYALTLSAVTLRLYAFLFDYFNVDIGPKETYTILAYASWIPNLILAEILIRWKYPEYLMKKPKE